jgi:hypothetical protein
MQKTQPTLSLLRIHSCYKNVPNTRDEKRRERRRIKGKLEGNEEEKKVKSRRE